MNSIIKNIYKILISFLDIKNYYVQIRMIVKLTLRLSILFLIIIEFNTYKIFAKANYKKINKRIQIEYINSSLQTNIVFKRKIEEFFTPDNDFLFKNTYLKKNYSKYLYLTNKDQRGNIIKLDQFENNFNLYKTYYFKYNKFNRLIEKEIEINQEIVYSKYIKYDEFGRKKDIHIYKNGILDKKFQFLSDSKIKNTIKYNLDGSTNFRLFTKFNNFRKPILFISYDSSGLQDKETKYIYNKAGNLAKTELKLRHYRNTITNIHSIITNSSGNILERNDFDSNGIIFQKKIYKYYNDGKRKELKKYNRIKNKLVLYNLIRYYYE